jgi:L-lactate dehydrogenase (cytochrome)
MTKRQVPRWSELRPLMRLQPPRLSPTRRRLERCQTIWDLRAAARRQVPRPVFDYTDGAAEAEISLRRARRVFRDLEFRPSVLHDVSKVDTTATLLGAESAFPFAFAPTGFTRLMHHEGEGAVARVAQRRGIPYGLSTLGTTSIEDVAAAAPAGHKWFQLYVYRDRAAGADLAARAKAAGFEALLVAVDAPVSGARLRDKRNGFAIPPALTLKSMADISLHPAWWMNLLTTEPLKFASFASWDRTVGELMDYLLDPTMTIADLEWMRSIWAGPLVIKGIQTVEDARRVVDAGADAVVLSNHGGRQLDRAPVPLRLVPDVVGAVGDRAEVYVDTGIMSGADIAAAVALGATGALVGRAYLYGLMAGGEQGVDRAAEILTSELIRTMQLLGASDVSELGPQHVRLP